MKEIERRFLIDAVPDEIEIDTYKSYEIQQGYVFFDPVVRLRRRNNEYFLTVKSNGLLIREELEIPLSKETFDEMWLKTEGIIIKKQRFIIPLDNNLLCELDIFQDNLDKLKIAEIEFDNLENANKFTPPEWFGEEITFKPEYSNRNLSRYGLSTI